MISFPDNLDKINLFYRDKKIIEKANWFEKSEKKVVDQKCRQKEATMREEVKQAHKAWIKVSVHLSYSPSCHGAIDRLCRVLWVLKNIYDALNTFYLWLYGISHMVKGHSDSERGNPLPPHRLLFPISSKGSFICIIPQTG